jgi:regulator of sigma E protease
VAILEIVVLGAIGLGLMVFIHELGHFVAAKANGVGVETFSLGWGPRLVGFQRGGTWYQVSWFPIGGYCKMKGELVPGLAGGSADASQHEGVPAAAPVPGSFLAAPAWRRITISLAGPAFNLVFAFLVFFVIWWAGFSTSSPDNRVILARDYPVYGAAAMMPAEAAGLRTGDRIVAVDGKVIRSFQDIQEAVVVSPGKALRFTVERQGEPSALDLVVTPRLNKETGGAQVGILAWLDPQVASAAKGSAAAIAGIRAGDRVTAVDGTPVVSTADLDQALAAKPTTITLTIERAGAADTLSVIPRYDDASGTALGLAWKVPVFRSPVLGFGGAVVHGLEETGSTIVQTVRGIGLLFQGINLRSAVAGPLRITYYIGTVAASGFAQGAGAGLVESFRMIGLLSIVLFLMNLLPIPAMDGGQIILFIVEMVRGRPVRSLLFWRLQLIGFSLLIGLFIFVTYSDILFFMGR